MKRIQHTRGFTLVEIAVGIVLIGLVLLISWYLFAQLR